MNEPKLVSISFPLVDHTGKNLRNKVHDYLIDSICDKSLDLTYEEYVEIEIEDIWLVEDFKCDGVDFKIYEVELQGPQDIMDRVENWNNNLKENEQ